MSTQGLIPWYRRIVCDCYGLAIVHPSSAEEPGLTELIALQGKHTCINIAEQIGTKWRVVGIGLLQDRSGNTISSINEQYRGDNLKINIEILQRWVNGQGIVDRSWHGLLGVLRVHCAALAQSVEEALTADETTDSPPMDQPPPSPPPPPSLLRHFLWSLRSCFQRQQHMPRPTGSPHIELSGHRHPTPQPEPLPTVKAQQPTPHLLHSSHSLECADPPPADQPGPPPQPPPRFPPLQPQSAVWYFNAYLKSIYNSIIDPIDTWPPSPSEKFINLAVITREKADSKKQHAFMLASLHGGVDVILETKAPVTIEKLLDMPTGKKLKCVLIEGAPGVGKSTFSWEICRRWAEGIIFQQFSLVLLLRLRDETVQNAQTIKNLVPLYTVEEYLEEVSQYLKHTRGKHTLLILEGLDELPKHLLTQPSIFTRLLDGTELPDAVILVTSRPSATPHLWQNWKKRISKHIEILGFTDQNIKDYVASILDPEEIPAFHTYLCTAPSIRQLMYIPLHSGIAIELYRMSSDSDRPLPTTKTELYTALVQIILTRYLAKHPKYKDHEIEVKKFTDLPPDISPLFRELTQLAYYSLSQQQLIFKDKDRPIEHLGFMDVVAELFPFGRKVKYSYNFLHLSLQEYLAAVHVSLMDTGTQEGLLETLFREPHLNNMGTFLAAITHFEGMDREVVKKAILINCEVVSDEHDAETKELLDQSVSLLLSPYVLQLVYETKDVSLLQGHSDYTYVLSDYSPLVEFTALGYCMANGSHKWTLLLGNSEQYMQSTQGIDQLVHALSDNTSPSYTIHTIACWYEETEIPQRLLTVLPQQTLQYIHTLLLDSKTPQPTPQCLPQVVHKMNTLRVLGLKNATADSLTTTLEAVSTCNLEALVLQGCQLTLAAMQAYCSALLRSNNTIEVVDLARCDISDELVLCLAKALPSLNKLEELNLDDNDIGDEGRAALEEYKETNEQVELSY